MQYFYIFSILYLTGKWMTGHGHDVQLENLNILVQNELERLEKHRDDFIESCGAECNQTKWPRINKSCYCDSVCIIYSDCCFDYWAFCFQPRQVAHLIATEETKQLTRPCHPKNTNQPIATCLPGANPNDRNFCTQNDSMSVSDVRLHRLPVYDRNLQILYRNYYCAKCNQVDNKSIDILLPNISCSNKDGVELGSLKIKCKYEYVEKTKELRVCQTEELYRCHDLNSQEQIDQLDYYLGSISGLQKNLSTSEYYSRLCDAYVMPLSVKIRGNHTKSIVFRNFHCFKCWLSKRLFSANTYETIKINDTKIVTTTHLPLIPSLAKSIANQQKYPKQMHSSYAHDKSNELTSFLQLILINFIFLTFS
jgi:hypothetical protein